MTQLPDLYIVSLKLVGALILVLFILYFFFRVFRNVLQKNVQLSGNRIVKVLENNYLGSKKSITVFKVPGGVLVVGISSDRMDLLAHIKDEEGSLLSQPVEDKKRNNSFADTLLRLLPVKKSGENHEKS